MGVDPQLTRLQKARADTQWWRFRREVLVGIAVLPFAFVALELFGSPEGARDQVIGVGASALVVMVLLPFAEFFWNWLHAPMRLLRSDVAALRQEVAALPAALPQSPPPAAAPPAKAKRDPQRARLEILRRIENELRAFKRGAERALESQRSTHFKKDTTNWTSLTKGSGDGWTLAGMVEWQPLYEQLREVYEAVEEAPSGVSSGLLSGQREALDALVPQLDAALKTVRLEIKKIVGEAGALSQ